MANPNWYFLGDSSESEEAEIDGNGGTSSSTIAELRRLAATTGLGRGMDTSVEDTPVRRKSKKARLDDLSRSSPIMTESEDEVSVHSPPAKRTKKKKLT